MEHLLKKIQSGADNSRAFTKIARFVARVFTIQTQLSALCIGSFTLKNLKK